MLFGAQISRSDDISLSTERDNTRLAGTFAYYKGLAVEVYRYSKKEITLSGQDLADIVNVSLLHYADLGLLYTHSSNLVACSRHAACKTIFHNASCQVH